MLSSVYIFVCEGLNKQDGKISALNILDKSFVANTPTVIQENMFLVFGLIGEESDHDNEFTIRIRGKKLDFTTDVKYIFNGYDNVSFYNMEISNFPVSEEQIVYFELLYKNKTIAKYPLKFEVKES